MTSDEVVEIPDPIGLTLFGRGTTQLDVHGHFAAVHLGIQVVPVDVDGTVVTVIDFVQCDVERLVAMGR